VDKKKAAKFPQPSIKNWFRNRSCRSTIHLEFEIVNQSILIYDHVAERENLKLKSSTQQVMFYQCVLLTPVTGSNKNRAFRLGFCIDLPNNSITLIAHKFYHGTPEYCLLVPYHERYSSTIFSTSPAFFASISFTLNSLAPSQPLT
jgi:hypothetical protein